VYNIGGYLFVNKALLAYIYDVVEHVERVITKDSFGKEIRE
jgi:hypothetical protein